ncbi:MAG: ATP-dependent DNA ligase, partial [Paracoccaceae bacterium]
MRAFAQLFMALDATTSLAAKTAALAVHFRTAPEADRVWTVALLSGRRPKRAATTTELRQWAAEAAGVPPWLFDECHAVTGDLAETIALILPVAAVAPEASPGLAETIGGLARLPGQPAE